MKRGEGGARWGISSQGRWESGRAPPTHGRLAERVGWAGREAEAQLGEGERPIGEGKRKWAAAGPKTGAGPNSSNKTFLNFYLEFEYLATLEICTRKFRRNFDMGIFPKIFWAFLWFLEMKTNGMWVKAFPHGFKINPRKGWGIKWWRCYWWKKET
jgi:hypothetical protein